MAKDRKFKAPPLGFITIYAIFVTELILLLILRPNIYTPVGGKIFFAMLVGLLICHVLLNKLWRTHHPCSIFYGPGKEIRIDLDGHPVNHYRRDISCGQKSVGRIKTEAGRKEFFCQDHDPEISWMNEWMRKHGIRIIPGTLVRSISLDE